MLWAVWPWLTARLLVAQMVRMRRELASIRGGECVHIVAIRVGLLNCYAGRM